MTIHHEHDVHEDLYFAGTEDAHCSGDAPVPTEPKVQPWELHDALAILTARQRYVLECSWGLRDGTCYSFREIGEAMGIRWEAARKHYHAAMENLRKQVPVTVSG